MSSELPDITENLSQNRAFGQGGEKLKSLAELRALVERIGGRWQVDDIEVEDMEDGELVNKKIYAFYVPAESADGIEWNLSEGLGYKSEDVVDDPDNFPRAGRYRMIFYPILPSNPHSQREEYFFRVAEK